MTKSIPASARSTRLGSALVLALSVAALVALTAPFSTAEERGGEDAWLEISHAADRMIAAQLEAEGVAPAPRADDAEFLRRLYLDLLGTVPTAEEAQAFTQDRSPDKRRQKIEELLASPAYGENWGTVWFKTLTGLSPGGTPRQGGQEAQFIRGKPGETFLAWLQDQMTSNRPYNELVEELLTASGRTDENGATGFYARWSMNVNNLAGATSKVFLGTRIQCAQCHDHIYEESWKQSDFKGMAAFFATTSSRRSPEYVEFQRMRRQMEQERQKRGEAGDGSMDEMDGGRAKNPREERERLAKLRGSRQTLIIEERLLTQRQVEQAERFMARQKKQPAQGQRQERMALLRTTPKFWLASESPDLPGISRRYLLARWITSDDNELFHRTLVNRYWGHFLGAGFVNPVDDFNSFNEPSHPALLDLLAKDFVQSGYDLKRLVRIIVNTDAYQRTSHWDGDEAPDPTLFAKAPVRPLSTEQLYHALVRATGIESRLDRQSRRKSQQIQQAIFSAFSFVFDDDEGLESQDFEGSIPQGLFLMNGELLQRAVSASRGMPLQQLLREEASERDRIERLFWAAYGRKPEAAEASGALRFVKAAGNSTEAYEDLLWALLNSAEFMTNH